MTKKVKRISSLLTAFTVMLFMLFSGALTVNAAETTVKNVIIMIPDGMSIAHTTLARWYNGGTPLTMDEMACGLVRTYSSDAAIADSAPAGTAYATGYKSHTGFVGVLPDVANMPGQVPIADTDKRKPVTSVLEGAKLLGKSTGLVVTCEICHATPSDFSSHYPSRHEYDILSEQEVYNNIDVVLGGGSDVITPGTGKNNRKDGENLIQVLKDRGYDYVTTKDGMTNSTSNKIWGMFAPMAMAYDMDRDASKEPSLAEMTDKAISTLSKNTNGFFLMVEGSKIDWAAHANDPVGVVSDVLAFDKAVKVALDFAKKDGNTDVIVVADHNTGGMTIGDAGTTSGYDTKPLSNFIAPLKKATLTGEGLEAKFNADKSNIKEVMAQYFGITDLTDAEVKAIASTKAGSMNYTVGPIISKRANIGWTTGGHSGEEIVLYAYSPNNYKPTNYTGLGVVDNTDIGKYIAKVLGIDLDTLNKELFIPAREAFEAKGATVSWDTTDVKNPVVVVKKGSDILRLPINKNIAELNGKAMELKSLVIFNGIKSYVPKEAVDLIK